MKPILFVLNDRRTVKSGNTTAALMLACLKRGHSILVTDVVHLQASSAVELFAECVSIPVDPNIETGKTLAKQFAKAAMKRVSLTDVEAIFIRTTPGKDIIRSWAHRLTLEVLRLAHEIGVPIFNDPIGLQRASSKLYTVCLPEKFVPRTMVCHSPDSVQLFAKELDGPFVMKPLLGSQGRDVFFLDEFKSLNTRQIVDILGRTGYIVVQEYVPEATSGDIRVLTLDSAILSGNAPTGIRRTPAVGERRSNISLGGSASMVELTDRQASMCREVANHLHRDGIRLAGIDLIGEKIVEVNVFSPSGLQEFDPKLKLCERALDTLLQT